MTATTLDIPYLRDFYDRALNHTAPADPVEAWLYDQTLRAGLNLNVLETARFLNTTRPTFEAFEDWILEQNHGAIDDKRLDRLRRALAGETVEPEIPLDHVEGLTEEDLVQWDEHGYVILRSAVTPEAAEAAELAIYEHLHMDRGDSATWYADPNGRTIWVPLLRHPALDANRRSPRIHKAFAQLWQRGLDRKSEDLWTTIDQGGLNPPERPGWEFPGPHLHWDTTLAEPHHLAIGGILYLADVAENQGAFHCAPGFHKQLKPWLDSLAPGADPRVIARQTLILKAIAANRGDLVLWHQSLPHAASPNTATRPRVAQYISMHPTRYDYNPRWK